MTPFLKLVALAMMLIMGAVPMFGSPLAPQCMHMSSSAMNATSHCAMMAMMAAAADSSKSISGTDEMPPCCRVVPAKPVRTVELQVSAASAELALQPADEAVSAMPSVMPVRGNCHIPPPDSARSQSRLCTFLI